ncbi:MAG: phage antirepressor N-terminal domain-containing protein [Intestinimonas sp.]|jgi:hypothetical protein|nr:phage antirepressor N-terminal domain-containing protein [Intestinimonas sp.]
MNCQLEIKQVPFMGTNLVAARDNDGHIWAAVRWMCDGIGLSSGQTKAERLRIQGDKVLSKGGRNLVLPTKGGNQETLCLKLDFIPLWLVKISITPNMAAETPELAAALEQYQLRAKDVLAAAFLPISTVPDIGELSPELRLLINMELKQKQQQRDIEAVNQRLDDIKDVVALSPNSWRPEARGLIVRIARQMGGNEFIREVQAEIFKLVDKRAGVSLETRLTNKRRRMAEEGVCKSKRDRLNKANVIGDDRKLIEIYVAIVKEMAVKYGVTDKKGAVC